MNMNYDWHPFFCIWPRRIEGKLVFLKWIEVRDNWYRYGAEARLIR